MGYDLSGRTAFKKGEAPRTSGPRQMNRADAPKICNDATLDHFLSRSATVQTKFYRAESQARLCKEMWALAKPPGARKKREPAVDVD